jgi:peptide/nickel transport system ATP-binding protein
MSVNLEHLQISIAGKNIVKDISMHIGDGERVGLIGASGSGKSMIAKACLGLLPAMVQEQGSIHLGQQEVIGSDERRLAELRGSATALVMQNPAAALNPVKRVLDQIALPLKLHYRLNRRQIRERVIDILRRVDLPETVAERYPHQLSGGQQQRVAIATALVTSPRFIVADEPTTALDSITQQQILKLLVSLVDDSGASMLFITHDFSVLAHATSRCYVLDDGLIVEEGPTQQLLEAPEHPFTKVLVDAATELTFQQARSPLGVDRNVCASDVHSGGKLQ